MDLEIAGGTATGRSHALAGKPNQDAYAWIVSGDILVAAVCDGCGSGAHSEVGAALGARIVTARLAARLAEGASPDAPALLDGVRDDLLGALGGVASAMGGRLADIVSEHFLFTVVGLAIAGERGCVFAAGDGIVAVDESVIRLGPFPRNEPPYLGYGLLDGAGAPGLSLIRGFGAREVRSVLLGTDGTADLADLAEARLPGSAELVGPLRRFWEDDRHFENRDALRRRLALVNREVSRPNWAERRVEREGGLLCDDTTIVVARRRRAR
jgi:hypothetical protein